MDDFKPVYVEYFENLITEAEDVHSVMVEIPRFKALDDYIAAIPENIVYEPQNPQYGKEKHPHITVLYGIEPMEEEKAKALLRKVPAQVTATLGSITIFTDPPEFDVLKIDVSSPYLARINKFLRDNVEYQNDFPRYHPHVTLAYLKKGTGKEFANDNRFAGMKFVFPAFLYSDELRNKERIPITAGASGSIDEYGYGAGGQYGGAPGGEIAARGWAGTWSSPETSTRLNMYPKQSGMRATAKANTVRGIDPYDAVNPQDLQDPRFSPDEIRTGIRYEMARMEFPNKDIARSLVLKHLESNPKFYSDLHQYFDTEK